MIYKSVLVVFALTFSLKAFACKCNDPGTVEESYNSASIIFHGKVISRRVVSFAKTIRADKEAEVRKSVKPDLQKQFDSDLIFEVTLQVIDRFKGAVGDTLTVFTPILGASCGYRFETEKHYIVYASAKNFLSGFFLTQLQRKEEIEKENTWWTNHCTRTNEYYKAEADELKKLRN